MKVQTGIRINAETWRIYREICRTERIRPSEPIQKFISIVIQEESALSACRLLENRKQSTEAYVRVLLTWLRNGKRWIKTDINYDGNERYISIEHLLLQALKNLKNKKLTQRVERALIELK